MKNMKESNMEIFCPPLPPTIKNPAGATAVHCLKKNELSLCKTGHSLFYCFDDL